MDANQAEFEGWAIVDVLGHQRHIGYVTTHYFGQTAFFWVATPARNERSRVLDDDGWFDKWGLCPKGCTVTESGGDGSRRYIGAGSIYQIEPTTQDAFLKLLDAVAPRTVLSVLDAEGKSIEPPKPIDDGIPF